MILLTGATGTVGRLITAHLQAARVDFTLLSRDVGLAKTQLGESSSVIEGSLANAPDWLPQLPKNLTVFSLAPVTPDMAQIESLFFDALAAHGVAHIAKLSAWRASAKSPVIITRQHGLAETHLKALGVDFTILQAQYFLQNLLGFGITVAQTGRLSLPMGSERCAPIDAADIAAVAVRCLLDPVAHRGQTYALTGPDLLDFECITKLLSQVIGREVQYDAISALAFQKLLTGWSVSDWLANGLAEVFVSLAGGDANYTTDTVRQLTGRPARSVRAFLEANQAVFA